MTNFTLVLVMDSATGHSRWFTPSEHISGGLTIEACKARIQASESWHAMFEGESASKHFVQHVSNAVAALCKEHAIDKVVFVGSHGDYAGFTSELLRLVPTGLGVVRAEPKWAELSIADLCERLAEAHPSEGVVAHHGASRDPRNPGAISGAQAQFVHSGLTPFERERMS